MSTVLDKTKDIYLTKMFKLYAELAEEYINQMIKYADEGDFDKAEYYRLRIIDCIARRQDVLDKLMELKGYR